MLLACAAIGIRMIGLGHPIRVVAVLVGHTGRWGRRARLLIAPLLCVPFAAAILLVVDVISFTSADVTSGTMTFRVASAARARLAYTPGVDAVEHQFGTDDEIHQGTPAR